MEKKERELKTIYDPAKSFYNKASIINYYNKYNIIKNIKKY